MKIDVIDYNLVETIKHYQTTKRKIYRVREMGGDGRKKKGNEIVEENVQSK